MQSNYILGLNTSCLTQPIRRKLPDVDWNKVPKWNIHTTYEQILSVAYEKYVLSLWPKLRQIPPVAEAIVREIANEVDDDDVIVEVDDLLEEDQTTIVNTERKVVPNVSWSVALHALALSDGWTMESDDGLYTTYSKTTTKVECKLHHKDDRRKCNKVRRVRRNMRSPYVKSLINRLRDAFPFVLTKFNDENYAVLYKAAIKLARDDGLRATHTAKYAAEAVDLYFVPTQEDIRNVNYRNTRALRDARAELSAAPMDHSWQAWWGLGLRKPVSIPTNC